MTVPKDAPIFSVLDELRAHVAAQPAGRRVVLANGCFDPLHVGHVRYLRDARGAGDFLVVAVNDDDSARALKGDGRPVVPASSRAEILAALTMVDAVLVFSAPDVTGILEGLRPAVHAKGTDYSVDTVPEVDVARRLGIETVIAGDPKSHASSEVVRRLQGSG